nr:hypothetical protein CFP56_69463 [Quercus suber]
MTCSLSVPDKTALHDRTAGTSLHLLILVLIVLALVASFPADTLSQVVCSQAFAASCLWKNSKRTCCCRRTMQKVCSGLRDEDPGRRKRGRVCHPQSSLLSLSCFRLFSSQPVLEGEIKTCHRPPSRRVNEKCSVQWPKARTKNEGERCGEVEGKMHAIGKLYPLLHASAATRVYAALSHESHARAFFAVPFDR